MRPSRCFCSAAESAPSTIRPVTLTTAMSPTRRVSNAMDTRSSSRRRKDTPDTHDFIGQLADIDRLRDVAVHARGQAALPVAHHRIRGEGDDGDVPAGLTLAFA